MDRMREVRENFEPKPWPIPVIQSKIFPLIEHLQTIIKRGNVYIYCNYLGTQGRMTLRSRLYGKVLAESMYVGGGDRSLDKTRHLMRPSFAGTNNDYHEPTRACITVFFLMLRSRGVCTYIYTLFSLAHLDGAQEPYFFFSSSKR